MFFKCPPFQHSHHGPATLAPANEGHSQTVSNGKKHFTVDKSLPGPDHRMSLDQNELKDTIYAIRNTEKSLGNIEKKVLPAPRKTEFLSCQWIRSGEFV